MKKRIQCKQACKSKHKAIVFHGALPVRPLLLAAGLLGLPQMAAAAFPANINLVDLNGTNGFKLSGVAANDWSGSAVSTAGDVNGDGIDDLLIGAPRADPNGYDSGASYVVFGGKKVGSGGNLELSALDGTNGFRLSGVAAYDFSGSAVSAAGDVNSDGVDDLLIGAFGADPNGDYSGASYVVFGGAGVGSGGNLELSALDGTNGFKLSGAAAGDSAYGVSEAGDVNGDGVDDLLIGASGASPNGTYSGASYVVFGGAEVGSGGNLELSALNGTNGFKLSGVATRDFSGKAVSTAGDLNGDGLDDLLIGTFGPNANGINASGASYVVFGGAAVGSSGNLELSALDGTNGFKLSGAAALDFSGTAVSTAGDVSGDGVDDLLIGAPGFQSGRSGASYVLFGQVDTALLCFGKVPTMIGTEGNNVLVGTDGDDVIMSLGGKDIILGHDGRDTICGGDGNDKILAGGGMDWLFGGRGKDLAQGEDNSDVLNGGSGPDVCNGGDGQDRARNCEKVIKVP